MAEEKERVYTVPLGRAWRVPRDERTNRALADMKIYIARHMKIPLENVWVDYSVSTLMWERGSQRPPRKMRVRAVEFREKDETWVEVSLPE